MGRNPFMQRPINECVDLLLSYNSKGIFNYGNDEILGVVKLYCLLHGYSLVHNNTYRKYILEGLNRQAGKSVYVNFKEMSTEHISLTDEGLAYCSVYRDEGLRSLKDWESLSSRIADEAGYKDSLLYRVKSYQSLYGGADSIPQKESVSVLPTKELKEMCQESFESLEALCKEMARTSNNLIREGFTKGSDEEFMDFLVETHKKYYSTASMNDKELLKQVAKVKQEVMDALSVLGLIERLGKNKELE